MRNICWFVAIALICSLNRAYAAGRSEMKINDRWRFVQGGGALPQAYETPGFNDSKWEAATLPHTPHVESKYVQYVWQGVAWYRRHLATDPAWQGKQVSIEFGAAMQVADVYFNGKLKTHHIGGYLPFTIDITHDLAASGDNVIAVMVDNRDSKDFPPGKSTQTLDFVYPSGIYRGVTLRVTEQLHISDPLVADKVAGGGVFVRYENVTRDSADVLVQTDVENEGQGEQSCAVESDLFDPTASMSVKRAGLVTIAPRKSHTFEQKFVVLQPKLWELDHPDLYSLRSRVVRGDTIVDEIINTIGIRHIELSQHALVLNGKSVVINGANRHQEYPYVEYAMSPEASRRDARLIKDGGFNFVRLSHYPQDPAFLDECDRIGLLVQEPIPGWQQFWNTPSFIEASNQFERDMIRRDRNHPSIVFWEPNLNETHSPTDFRVASQEIAHQEYPGDQCLTFGDPYSGAPWDVKGLVREYGDWAFGGNSSTSRQTRDNGEKAMLQEAWNFQWTWNALLKRSSDPKQTFIGGATWVMYDYNRGYNAAPCTCGMMDIFRLPKYVYYFYQSQHDPAVIQRDGVSGPMVFIANEWTQRTSPAKVVVYSNCEEVELQLNGRVIARQKPDSGPDTDYAPGANLGLETVGSKTNKSGGNPYDGGNCMHLAHPPFTFSLPFEAGALNAVGYIAGKPAAKFDIMTPGAPAALQLTVDTAGVPMATNDVVIVHASVVDAAGTVVPGAKLPVTFGVTGEATLIGENPVEAEAGIASILVRTSLKGGEFSLTASAEKVTGASGRFVVGAAMN